MASYKKTTLAIDGRPHKDESTEASGESTSTHKARSTWFQARESWPWREGPIDLLTSERARVAAEVPPAAGVASWEQVGPSNIGGRMTCAVCHPTSPDRLWAWGCRRRCLAQSGRRKELAGAH